MSDDKPTDNRPSVSMLAFSALASVYLVWALFLAGGERPSVLLQALFAIVLLANLGFLIVSLLRWRK